MKINFTRPETGTMAEKINGEHENVGEVAWGDKELTRKDYCYPSPLYWPRLQENRLIAQKLIREMLDHCTCRLEAFLGQRIMDEKWEPGVQTVTYTHEEVMQERDWAEFQGVAGDAMYRFYANHWQPQDPEDVIKEANKVCDKILDKELSITF